MKTDLILLMPEITVAIGVVFALIAEMFRASRTAFWITLTALAVATGLTIPMLGLDTFVFEGTYRIDTLSIWAKLILLPATVMSVFLARSELGGTDREGAVYILMSLVTLAAIFLSGVGDTMLLVLGVLLAGLASFALVAYPRNDAATEAAMKFFVFASVTGAIMVFGLSYWFAGTGSTLLDDLPLLGDKPILAILGLLSVLVGLGYKAALAPFHFWAPDAYDGAPVSVAAYMSVVPKTGAIFALAQVISTLPVSSGWPMAVSILAVLSMTYGYLAALVQNNIVRLLAYSSIAQAGYFLLAIVAIGTSDLSLTALVIFAAAYAAMNLGAFAVIMRVGRNLHELIAMGRRHVMLGVAMVIFLLSLTGIPPLAGFVGKFLLFAAAIEADFLWLTIIAILNSVLSLAVYLRLVIPMYQKAENKVALTPMPWVSITWIFALFFTIGIGMLAQTILGKIG